MARMSANWKTAIGLKRAGSLEMFQRTMRYLMVVAGVYLLYLVMLGPFWALDGRGHLDVVPIVFRNAIWWPAMPVYAVPGLRHVHADYIDWWYLDPNAADRPTGW